MKTLIAIPCMDQVAAAFSQSLAMLHKVGDCYVVHMAGSLVYDSRNKLVKTALELKCDYIMWFDSDMLFEPDTLERLMKHMEDGKNFVSGVYYRRSGSYKPVLYKDLIEKGDGELEVTEFDEIPDELFKADGVGFGCVLMKTSMLLDMALNEGDWFTPEGHAGEDISFCLRAKRCGYDIWVDPSVRLGHVGVTIVTKEFYDAFCMAKEKKHESNS